MPTKQPAFAMHQIVTLHHTEYGDEPVEILERHWIQREQRWGFFVRFLEREESGIWAWEWQLSAERKEQSA